MSIILSILWKKVSPGVADFMLHTLILALKGKSNSMPWELNKSKIICDKYPIINPQQDIIIISFS